MDQVRNELQSKPRKIGSYVLLVGLFCIVLLVLGLYIGYSNGVKNAQKKIINEVPTPIVKKELQSIPSPTRQFTKQASKLIITMPDEWRTFISRYLGISFDYPNEWGDVIETIQDYGNNPDIGQAGKSYNLSFTNKIDEAFEYKAYGVGKSVNFSAARGSIFSDYKGEPNSPAFIKSEIPVPLRIRCYSYMYDSNPYKGIIRFNLPGKEISGIVLVVPILSEADANQYDTMVNEFVENEKQCVEKYDNNPEAPIVIAKEREFEQKLLDGVDFDEESKVNLTIFNRIVKSARLL